MMLTKARMCGWGLMACPRTEEVQVLFTGHLVLDVARRVRCLGKWGIDLGEQSCKWRP